MLDLHSELKPKNLIRNCEFKFKCPKKWDDLRVSSSLRAMDSPRRCDECHKLVWKVDTEEELAQHVLNNRCVAISPELYGRTVAEEHRQRMNANSGRLLGNYSLGDE